MPDPFLTRQANGLSRVGPMCWSVLCRRTLCVLLGITWWALVPRPAVAQQMHRNAFESNHTSWIKGTADAAFEETIHTMSDQVAHEGQRSEYIQVNAKQGTHIYYYYPTAKAPIAEDLTAGVW